METILVDHAVFTLIGVISTFVLVGAVLVLEQVGDIMMWHSGRPRRAYIAATVGLLLIWTWLFLPALMIGIGAGGEEVGAGAAFEAESRAGIKSFTRGSAESLGIDGDITNLLVWKSVDGEVTSSERWTYTVMEDTYGDGGVLPVTYEAEDVRIYEDIDGEGESPYVEAGTVTVRRRATWLFLRTEWEDEVGEEVRMHVRPGSVLGGHE